MPVRAIRRISSTAQLRSILPNAIDVGFDSTALKYKDVNGTVQQIVKASDTDPFSAVDGAVRFVEVTLTNAQIKAVRATPVQLVAAPGAGKVLKFIGAWLKLVAGANVLTETAANLGIKYTDGAGVQVNETVECTGFIDQAADTATEARPKLDPIVATVAGAINKALVLHNLGAGEFAGNAAADATLKVKVWYSVVTA